MEIKHVKRKILKRNDTNFATETLTKTAEQVGNWQYWDFVMNTCKGKSNKEIKSIFGLDYWDIVLRYRQAEIDTFEI